MRIQQKVSGFTLIELIVVIVIMSILIGSGMYMLTQSFKAAYLVRELDNASWQGRLAFERMSRDIRATQFPTGVSINGTNTNISFTDTEANTTIYELSGSTLVRKDITGSINSDIASGISNLFFYPYDISGTQQTAIDENTRLIQVFMKASAGNTNINYQTLIYPPNFTPGAAQVNN